MQIKVATVEAGYELLRTCAPFSGWHLPSADEVEFHTTCAADADADYIRKPNGTHCIRVNDKNIGTLQGLLVNLMHEMAHLHHEIACPRDPAHHGAEFKKRARAICRIHHLDPKAF